MSVEHVYEITPVDPLCPNTQNPKACDCVVGVWHANEWTQQTLKDVHGDFLIGVLGLVDDTERIIELAADDGGGRGSAGQLLASRLQTEGAEERPPALAPRVRARMREVKAGRLVA